MADEKTINIDEVIWIMQGVRAGYEIPEGAATPEQVQAAKDELALLDGCGYLKHIEEHGLPLTLDWPMAAQGLEQCKWDANPKDLHGMTADDVAKLRKGIEDAISLTESKAAEARKALEVIDGVAAVMWGE